MYEAETRKSTASAISAALLARRLGRWWPVWAIASPLVAGIPGLILATMPTLQEPQDPAGPVTRPRVG